MTRKYTGNSDGVSRTGKTRPGVTKLLDLAKSEYGFSNLGGFVNRRMNNDRAKADPNNPKYLSVHATGRAIDMGYRDRKKAVACWDFLIANTALLGIEEIHDYAFDPDGAGKGKPWGRGYRCSRGEGAAGVNIFSEKNNAGTPGGMWLHVELSPAMADNPTAFEAAWRTAKGSPVSAPAQSRPTPAPAPPAPAASGPRFPGDLDVGSKGEAVKLVQAKVGAKADGDFGPATGRSVSAWREANGLGKGTKVGPKTWAKMFG
jgi:hypothetical protein